METDSAGNPATDYNQLTDFPSGAALVQKGSSLPCGVGLPVLNAPSSVPSLGRFCTGWQTEFEAK